VARDRIPSDGIPKAYWAGAPDLAVEVLSPGETRSEIDEKIEDYLTSGVKQIWYVDPSNRRLLIHRPDAPPQTLTEADTLEGGDLLSGFQYPLARLFSFE
jgi:Uma2 family endonuclease